MIVPPASTAKARDSALPSAGFLPASSPPAPLRPCRDPSFDARFPRHQPPCGWISYPFDIACRYEGEEDELKPVKLFDGVRGTKEGAHHILWAGCRADQTSADAFIDEAYNGAFSYYFCHHMRRSNGQLSRKELLARIRSSLSHGGYSQVPQLETDATARAAPALTASPRKKNKK